MPREIEIAAHSRDENETNSPRNAFGAVPIWQRPRGVVELAGGRTCIGRVGAPPGQEATSAKFCFWIPEDALVEATQIVSARCAVPGAADGQEMTYYGLVDEVHRCSRRRGMGHEVDEFDGDLADAPPYASEGITYATASILRTDPAYLTPPRERTHVVIASDAEAQSAYGVGEIAPEKRLAVGIIKNGGVLTAGPGSINLDYLLGANGGHLNISGSAGRATKSSFLLTVIYLLLAKARADATARPSALHRLSIVPIIFNVKNFDLMYIDRKSRRYDAATNDPFWAQLGVPNPAPFTDVCFFAPQRNGTSNLAIDTGRTDSGPDRRPLVQPYSWSLADIVQAGLLTFLFSEDDTSNDNFAALALDIENHLTDERTDNDGTIARTMRRETGIPQTFQELSDWLIDGANGLGGDHHSATVKKLSRRLVKLILESGGVLRRSDQNGHPLEVRRGETSGPIVVDLNGLAGRSSLQRFVVAAVLRQLVDARTGPNAVRGLKYLVALDELNRFAPRGGRDSVTKLFETVAGEMRSQGILLFGAQQQASLVSTRVIENASIKALGQTGRLELGAAGGVWSSLSESSKSRAEALRPDEKLIIASGFRQPMHVRVPFPVWAMNAEEALPPSATSGTSSTTDDIDVFGDIH